MEIKEKKNGFKEKLRENRPLDKECAYIHTDSLPLDSRRHKSQKEFISKLGSTNSQRRPGTRPSGSPLGFF